jgi:hypothetical protein
MEVNLQQRRKGLEVKIPDIQQTLTVVQFLQNRRLKAKGEKVEEEELSDDDDDEDDLEEDEDEGKKGEPLKTLFELNDTLFAEAEVEETGEVGIWLGVSRSHYFHLSLFSVSCPLVHLSFLTSVYLRNDADQRQTQC